MFSPSTLRHNQRAICTNRFSLPFPRRPAPYSPLPRALCCPSCFSASIPFDHTGDSPRCCVSPRFASPRFFLFLTLCHNLSSPRRSRSRCNERCTLLSSCSHRRCFYSAAQSVSAQLPTRFARRFVSVVQVAFGMNQN